MILNSNASNTHVSQLNQPQDITSSDYKHPFIVFQRQIILTSLIISIFNNEIKPVNLCRLSRRLIILARCIFCIPCTYRIWCARTEIKPWLRSLSINCFGGFLSSRPRLLDELLPQNQGTGKDFDISFVPYNFTKKILRFSFPICESSGGIWMTRRKLKLERTC
jgi:hypothetical protein